MLVTGMVLLFIGSAIFAIVAGGISHFGEAISSEEVLFSLRMSVTTSSISTVICLLLSLPTAYALSHVSFPGKRLAEILMELTLSLPYILLGFALLLIFSSPLGKALKEAGFAVVFSPAGIVFAQMIVNLPFAIRMMRTAFAGVNPRVEFVAQTLGAMPWDVFRTIIVPMCRNQIISAFVLTWARGMGEFGATLMLVGVTRMKTETLPGGIEIRDMVARRGSFLLRVDELHIEPHEIFAIVGETGAGKTVLLEAIAGAFPLEAGSILLDGKDIRCLPVQQRRLGIVYQDHALFPHMTVAENIGYGLRMARVPKAEAARRVEEMLDLFSIRHIADRYPGIISGGEGQRAALARALVMRPEILLLDEPFSALDPTTKKRMYETLRDVHGRFRCTVVFVTHDFNEACSLGHRAGIILNGSLQAVCPADELFTREFCPQVMAFLGRG